MNRERVQEICFFLQLKATLTHTRDFRLKTEALQWTSCNYCILLWHCSELCVISAYFPLKYLYTTKNNSLHLRLDFAFYPLEKTKLQFSALSCLLLKTPLPAAKKFRCLVLISCTNINSAGIIFFKSLCPASHLILYVPPSHQVERKWIKDIDKLWHKYVFIRRTPGLKRKMASPN